MDQPARRQHRHRISRLTPTGLIYLDKFRFTEKEFAKAQVRAGDIAMTTSGNCGNVGYVRDEPSEPTVATNFVRILRGDPAQLDSRFAFHFLRSAHFTTRMLRFVRGAAMPNLSVNEAFRAITIPVPPLEVQREIVRILDAFTALEEELQRELQSELEYRRMQHAHYRAELLGSKDGVSDAALDDLVEFTNGKAHERLVVPDGSVALLTARFISTSGKQVRWVDRENVLTPVSTDDIAMVMSDLPNGRALARCFYVDANGKYTANQRVCRLRVRNRDLLSPRWLYHFLDRNPQLLAYDNAQDQTHLKKGQILGIRVPTIPLANQERIVARLDLLDQTNRELASALDAERVAQTQRYAYYRDRLLSFEETAA